MKNAILAASILAFGACGEVNEEIQGKGDNPNITLSAKLNMPSSWNGVIQENINGEGRFEISSTAILKPGTNTGNYGLIMKRVYIGESKNNYEMLTQWGCYPTLTACTGMDALGMYYNDPYISNSHDSNVVLKGKYLMIEACNKQEDNIRHCDRVTFELEY